MLDLPVGHFAPGYRFDALLIDPDADGGTIRAGTISIRTEDLVQKIVFTASRPNIAKVWVNGTSRR